MKKSIILLTALLGFGAFTLTSCDNNNANKVPLIENIPEKEPIAIILGNETLNFKTTDEVSEKTILNCYKAYDEKGKEIIFVNKKVLNYENLELNLKTEGRYEVDLLFTFSNNHSIKKHITIKIEKGYNGITKDLTKFQALKSIVHSAYITNYVNEISNEKITVISELNSFKNKIFAHGKEFVPELKNDIPTLITVETKRYVKVVKEINTDKLQFEFLEKVTPKEFVADKKFDYENYYYMGLYSNNVINDNTTLGQHTYTEKFTFETLDKNSFDLSNGIPEGKYLIKDENDLVQKRVLNLSVLKNEKGEKILVNIPKIMHKDNTKEFYFKIDGEKYYFADETSTIFVFDGFFVKNNIIYRSIFVSNAEKQNILDISNEENYIKGFLDEVLENNEAKLYTDSDFIELKNSDIKDVNDLIIDEKVYLNFNYR